MENPLKLSAEVLQERLKEYVGHTPLPVSYTHLDKKFLGTEPVGKLLLQLALPTVAAQLINMLYNIVDRIYIGHIPDIGAMALTGVGVCMPLIMIVTAFAAFAGYGGAPKASIFMGKGDHESAEKTLGNCFVLQIMISVSYTHLMIHHRHI